jgi:TFIIF-interacting CTD phosphatase-like protein
MEINIILDLDETLISAIDKTEEKKCKRIKEHMKIFRWEHMKNSYKIFERPGLQDFLDFLFQNFRVSIWTAASQTYAMYVIEKFILENHPERKIDYILFSYHCHECHEKTQTKKNLSELKNLFGIDYNLNNTYIIDDHPDVHQVQPLKCIKIKPFDITDKKCKRDEELMNRIFRKLYKILEIHRTIQRT